MRLSGGFAAVLLVSLRPFGLLRASFAGMTGEKAQGSRGAGEMGRKGKATIKP